MTTRCVLFDFDNTLCNTNSLKDIRETQQYDLLTDDELVNIKLYKPVPGILKTLQEQGVVMGIVTNSGRTYIRRLLAHLDIEDFFNTVVTYTDVKAAGMKPSPVGIQLALQRLGIVANQEVLYVGDTNLDIEAAYNAGITPVLPSWASKDTTSLPPAIEMSSTDLCNYFASPDEYALFAERCADLKTAKFDREAVYFLPLDDDANVVTMEDEITTFCFGRYFGQKSPVSAALHDGHALSLEIVKKDNGPVFDIPNYWFEMLAHVVQKTGESKYSGGLPFDIVTVIPAKQGKDPRLERLLAGVADIIDEQDEDNDIVFDGDVYFYDEDARSQKSLQRNERHVEATRTLHITKAGARSVAGKRVLIIDDVITTGATLQRARTLALEAGATSAIGVAIAKTVSITRQERECPVCSRPMKISKAKATGIRFWGCTGYHDDQCAHTEPFYAKNCPKCDRAMRIRTNGATKEKFWGCTGFRDDPQCSYTCNFDPKDAILP